MNWYVRLVTVHDDGERVENLYTVTRQEARDRARFYRTMSTNTLSATVHRVTN